MRFPDFFIIGAPKCGTTSLYDWLREHPMIYMSPIKEPEYYVPEHPWGRVISTENGYLRLFKKAKPNQLCGEATARYLFSATAVPMILRDNPRAKLIAMVRNPIEMAVSFHTQRLWNCRESIKDFPTAWRQRREPWYDYRALCSTGEQLERLLRTVDRRQVHVIVLDDLRDNPKSVYEETLTFLGIQTDGRSQFPVSNSRKTRRFDVIDRIIRHPPAVLAPIKRAMLSSMLLEAKRIRRRLNFLMTKPAPRTVIPTDLRSEMADFFAPDVALLGRLLGRDLSNWT